MKIRYLVPITMLFSLVATPVFADTTTSTPSNAIQNSSSVGKDSTKAALDKIRTDAKAAADKVRSDAKAAKDATKAAADKARADAKAAKDATKAAADKARATIQSTFEASIKAARATYKSVKVSKPDAATLASAEKAFNDAVTLAGKIKADAISALPAKPVATVKP